MPANKGNRLRSNPPRSGRETAASLPEDGELIAVLAAAIAAFREGETPVAITSLREVDSPAEAEEFYDEETPVPVSSFVARTIKRRG